jgi:prepilin-type N-terminal cleavage/methylation domain-containing protein
MAAGILMNERAGFTLFEVLISMVLLGITILGMQAAMVDQTLGRTNREEQRAIANQLVNDRIEQIQVQARNQYALIATGTESPVPGFAGWTRHTNVRSSVAPNPIFLTVTVRAWQAGSRDTLSRTIVVSP